MQYAISMNLPTQTQQSCQTSLSMLEAEVQSRSKQLSSFLFLRDFLSYLNISQDEISRKNLKEYFEAFYMGCLWTILKESKTSHAMLACFPQCNYG